MKNAVGMSVVPYVSISRHADRHSPASGRGDEIGGSILGRETYRKVSKQLIELILSERLAFAIILCFQGTSPGVLVPSSHCLAHVVDWTNAEYVQSVC
jgi:hypothetical protein